MNDKWDVSLCYMYGFEATFDVRKALSQKPIFPTVGRSKNFMRVNGPGLRPKKDE